jgi:hypothetical protein
MQTPLGRVADIHAWTFSNRLQPFQNFYVVGVVLGILRKFFRQPFSPGKIVNFAEILWGYINLSTSIILPKSRPKVKPNRCRNLLIFGRFFSA